METRNSRRKQESNFVIQGSILAAASIIVRLIGIAYRIPMVNIIGDEGHGILRDGFQCLQYRAPAFLLTAFLWLSPSWYPQDWRESSIAMPGA